MPHTWTLNGRVKFQGACKLSFTFSATSNANSVTFEEANAEV